MVDLIEHKILRDNIIIKKCVSEIVRRNKAENAVKGGDLQ